LEQSLRADVEAYVGGRLSGLEEEVERLRGQLDESLKRLSERMQEAAQGDPSLAVAISDHLRHARDLGIEAAASESARARASSDIALIKAGVDELDAQHTQADVLNALVNRAAAFAPRVAFFVVKSERATGWRARGLAGTVGDDTVRELSLSLQSDTLLGEVVHTRSTWAGEPGTHAEDHTIYNHFGGEPPQRMVAVPLVARERAVAVLYADSAGQDADAVNLEALETLVRVAGMSVELLASRRAPRAEAGAARPAAQAPAPSAPPEQPQPEEAREPQTHEPQAPAPESQAHAPQAHESQPTPAAPEAEPQPAPSFAPEPQAEHEPAPAQEPQPSFALTPEPPSSFATTPEPQPSSFASADASAAPAVEASASAESSQVSPLGASRRYRSMDMDFPVEVSEEDKRFHNEARRFARLLVSEIKLYNEQKVREGRDHADLYDRLREDIDRSRQMYDKRVRPEVSNRYDYFHHELVNMLAEGDPSKLGADYPGA
jgi:outer membrane biosynthesis protein TonB